MQVESALLFETPEQIYSRVFRRRTPAPEVRVEYCRFANANSFARLDNGVLKVRMADVLENAPAPVVEALAYILLSKLFRRPVPKLYSHRYRLYLNRKDVRGSLHRVRQARGRKFLSGTQGVHHNLESVFEELNFRYFHGLMARPGAGPRREASSATMIRPTMQSSSAGFWTAGRRFGWRSNMCCFTKCSICAIRRSTAAAAGAFTPANSGKRSGGSSGWRKPRGCSNNCAASYFPAQN